ncbi:hypothetical protein M9H77_03598 [Catharanthus roseus]|uniref:Uncharacterized protein n=1 Tax=Catharanthus roseus TaxID=4058 RepID=A0ACC0CBS0_CATRO|nr:hypothetical protein M9H77_03598 [Catharanthus roseus]
MIYFCNLIIHLFFLLRSDLGSAPEDLSLYKNNALSNLEHEVSTDSPIVRETDVVTSKVDTRHLLHLQVDTRNQAEFKYVRDVLELSGFSGNEFLGKWQSTEQPVDLSVFEEVEAPFNSSANEQAGSLYQVLLFDLINEVLLDIYDRSFSYWPMPLTCRSHIHPMPVGYHVLEYVWTNIRWYMNPCSEFDPSLDDAVSRDLAKDDGWMNIQFEAECVSLELEDLIFDDLLEELVFS